MKDNLTNDERIEILSLYRRTLKEIKETVTGDDVRAAHELLKGIVEKTETDERGRKQEISPIVKDMNTIYLTVSEIGMGKATVMSVLAFEATKLGIIQEEEIEGKYGKDVHGIVSGLRKASELYEKNAAVETENFRKLLLTFAEDIRVVFILIAERVYLMRNLEKFDDDKRQKIAREAAYLYAPMAHRMGLYKLKTELEDLSLKWTSPEIYNDIERRLKETKEKRDRYIADFISPLSKELHDAGFDFEIKGRTKSIYSIWNKMKKKGTAFENIYDIFAIRVILNSKPEKEKADCWHVYSIVTDKYQPNPKRLRDWISIPKSNGYEWLHTTVMGPEGKWVEVQIRTRRMDEIAEKGIAAHWKYKGIKGEGEGMDHWLKNLREILENPEKNAADFVDDFKLDLYDDDVFVFTPGGELKKLKKGATVLDFAFNIHSAIGEKCIGAKVNGKSVPIRHVLSNGDQVEIITSNNQTPKESWLDVVVTAKAKTKIKQVLRDMQTKDADEGKEMLDRRLKNWKTEYTESSLMRVIKKMGYKTVTEFYQAIAQEKVELTEVRDRIEDEQNEGKTEVETKSASEFSVRQPQTDNKESKDGNSDVLVIDKDLTGIEYKLAKCCNPIYGDKVFGFVSATGGIKIHRCDCPNAPQLISRFGYRIVRAKWSGKGSERYPVTIRVRGKDDIGIVTNITSLIQRDEKLSLRSISVDSKDGVFNGTVTVMVSDTADAERLIRQIQQIKGVTQTIRG